MNEKAKKVGNIILNVVVVLVLVFAFATTLSTILSGSKGYTNIFGYTMVSVESDSMAGGKYKDDDSVKVKGFNKGTLLFVKVLDDEDKSALQVNDVITYYVDLNGDGVNELNTHRIVNVMDVGYFETQGDNNILSDSDQNDGYVVTTNTIIGQYKGFSIPVLGYAVSFFHTSAGFFVCVVLPSLLIVAYFAFNLYRTVKEGNALTDEEKAAQAEAEKAKLKEELLREMREKGELPPESEKKDGE